MSKINVPDVVPTRGIDGLVENNATRDELIAFARKKEHDYERLKLFHDNWLQQAYAPLLASAGDIPDDELEQLITEAGWPFVKDKFGTPEEWQMWTNRFRRFRAVVIASLKGS